MPLSVLVLCFILEILPVALVKQAVFMEDILTCHGMKSTDANDKNE